MNSLKNCGQCPNLLKTNFYSSDGFDRMEDWICNAKDGKKIEGCVEWHEEDKIKIPEWCPLNLNINSEIEIKIPKGYMNIGISSDNKFIIGDTNDSKNWDTFKFPLPKGEWSIYNHDIKTNVLILKNMENN